MVSIKETNNMSTSDCKYGTSKTSCCEMNSLLQNTSIADNNSESICANCGKEGANNICNKCKSVRYCNAVCKKVHKKKHKKQCEEHVRLAAQKHNEELRRVAEKHDEELFKQPPPKEDCPICFIHIPFLLTGWRYQTCCGKVICSGCAYAPVYDNQGNQVDNKKCPFCRTPVPSSEEKSIKREEKRVEANDAIAIHNTGNYYRDGMNGYPQDHTTALELWHRAAELNHTPIYLNIGYAHNYGEGVEVDKEKATHYYELAAMGGCGRARHNLGNNEGRGGNVDRALKHYMIAIRSGYSQSLGKIKRLYLEGFATKDDYMKALQSYQTYLGEIKSKQRDEAAAAYEEYRYY